MQLLLSAAWITTGVIAVWSCIGLVIWLIGLAMGKFVNLNGG